MARQRSHALIRTLRHYYESDTRDGHRFRYALLAFDLVTILFIVTTSFLPRGEIVEWVDVLFGMAILADFPGADGHQPGADARVAASGHLGRHRRDRVVSRADDRRRRRVPARPADDADAAHLSSAGTAASGQPVVRQREEAMIAVAHLSVFIFVMTGIVYETQYPSNPHITNYADALYFTVTALTTTGFGDITLPGTTGRLILVVIMILGVTLFFNLARALLQPAKVRFRCPQCALLRHDPDAVHCKACGMVLNIPDEGYRY